MAYIKIEPRAHDLKEEQQASARITAQLADKPIIGTSGNEEHRLTPLNIKVRVGLTDEGQELTFAISHNDRHHPELVYKTIEAELAKLPELAGMTPKPLNAEKDYCHKKGEIKIRYAASGDAADNIIHALSHTYEEQHKAANQDTTAAPPSDRWVDKVQNAPQPEPAIAEPAQPAANDENWAQKAVNYLLTGNSRGI